MKLRQLGLTAVISLCAAGSAFAADAVMRISHPLPPSHHIAKVVEQFAADVEKNSGGKVDVQIFGSDQAFKANQNHAAVARGQMEAAVVTNFQWGGTIPEMNVMTIPYFMSTLDKVKAFPGSEVAKVLDAKLEEKGVKNIAWMFVTREAIFTSANKPIVEPDDFKGVKIRGLNKLVDNGLSAAGAAPASMPGS
nr:TRAP transporter substrate-binding protein DctP [Pseudomonas sp.]